MKISISMTSSEQELRELINQDFQLSGTNLSASERKAQADAWNAQTVLATLILASRQSGSNVVKGGRANNSLTFTSNSDNELTATITKGQVTFTYYDAKSHTTLENEEAVNAALDLMDRTENFDQTEEVEEQYQQSDSGDEQESQQYDDLLSDDGSEASTDSSTYIYPTARLTSLSYSHNRGQSSAVVAPYNDEALDEDDQTLPQETKDDLFDRIVKARGNRDLTNALLFARDNDLLVINDLDIELISGGEDSPDAISLTLNNNIGIILDTDSGSLELSIDGNPVSVTQGNSEIFKFLGVSVDRSGSVLALAQAALPSASSSADLRVNMGMNLGSSSLPPSPPTRGVHSSLLSSLLVDTAGVTADVLSTAANTTGAAANIVNSAVNLGFGTVNAATNIAGSAAILAATFAPAASGAVTSTFPISTDRSPPPPPANYSANTFRSTTPSKAARQTSSSSVHSADSVVADSLDNLDPDQQSHNYNGGSSLLPTARSQVNTSYRNQNSASSRGFQSSMVYTDAPQSGGGNDGYDSQAATHAQILSSSQRGVNSTHNRNRSSAYAASEDGNSSVEDVDMHHRASTIQAHSFYNANDRGDAQSEDGQSQSWEAGSDTQIHISQGRNNYNSNAGNSSRQPSRYASSHQFGQQQNTSSLNQNPAFDSHSHSNLPPQFASYDAAATSLHHRREELTPENIVLRADEIKSGLSLQTDSYPVLPSGNINPRAALQLTTGHTFHHVPAAKSEKPVDSRNDWQHVDDRANNRKTVGTYASNYEIDETLKAIIIKVASEMKNVPGQNASTSSATQSLDYKLSYALEAIDNAKSEGGISNKKVETATTNTAWEKEFSKNFQEQCKKCGILSGRDGSTVGLRTAYVPADVLDSLRTDVQQRSIANPSNEITKRERQAKDVVKSAPAVDFSR